MLSKDGSPSRALAWANRADVLCSAARAAPGPAFPAVSQLRAAPSSAQEVLQHLSCHFSPQNVLCCVPPSGIFAQSCSWFMAQGLRGEGEGAEFGVGCQGKWGPKELKVRQKMSGLCCLEVCNYNWMSDCTQFGIQKLLSASQTGNAGGASFAPRCFTGPPSSKETPGGKVCSSRFKGCSVEGEVCTIAASLALLLLGNFSLCWHNFWHFSCKPKFGHQRKLMWNLFVL